MVVSRLVYRKGMDLLAGLIPIICHRHENVDFLIGQYDTISSDGVIVVIV